MEDKNPLANMVDPEVTKLLEPNSQISTEQLEKIMLIPQKQHHLVMLLLGKL